MKKKLMSSLLAVTMVIGLLSGCGNAKESEEAVVESQEEVTEEADAVAEENVYPDYLNLEGFRPIVKEGEEITLKVGVVRNNAAQGTAEESWFAKYVEEVLNINLEIIEMNDTNLEEKKNLMFASNDLPDMLLNMGITNTEVVKYGSEGGLLLPVSDYLNETLTPNLLYTLNANPTSEVTSTAPDGKMYTIASGGINVEGRGSMSGTASLFVDINYMDAMGVETLPDTLDGFVEFLRKVKAENPSAYPVVDAAEGALFEKYLLNAFGWVTNTDDPLAPAWDVNSDSITVPALTERYGEFLKVMNTLYTEELIHPDYFTMDGVTARGYMAERACAIMGDAAPFLSVPDAWDEYIAVAPVSSEYCTTPIAVAGDGVTVGNIFISADTEYPELCVRFMDYLYSAEGSVYNRFGPWAEDEEALLGMKGFTAAEDGSAVVYQDLADSGYGDAFTYQSSEINLFYADINQTERNLLRDEELAGVPVNFGTDRTNQVGYTFMTIYDSTKDYLVERLPDVYMTEDQSVRYADLNTTLKNYVEAETAKFIVGQRSLEELDAFLEDVMKMGGEEYFALIQELYANYER